MNTVSIKSLVPRSHDKYNANYLTIQGDNWQYCLSGPLTAKLGLRMKDGQPTLAVKAELFDIISHPSTSAIAIVGPPLLLSKPKLEF